MPQEPSAPPVRFDVVSLDDDDQTILNNVAAYYHERLQQSPQAMEYLQSRGILNEKTVTRFRIGFVDRTLPKTLPRHDGKPGGEIRQRLKSVGILRTSGHEQLRGCVVAPFFDGDGNVVQIYGRRVDSGQGRTSAHYYLERPRTGLFNPKAFAESGELILCESVIDTLSFWMAGLTSVTTLPGPECLPDDLLSALKQNNVRRLMLAFDNDESGNGAVDEHRPAFEELGIELRRVQFPPGMDANEYAQKREPESLTKLIAEAQPLSPFKKSPTPVNGQPAPSKPMAPARPGVEVNGPDIHVMIDNRRYRVRGLERNMSLHQMKVNVLATRGELVHMDTFDLCRARSRAGFIKATATELYVDEQVIKKDVGRLLLELEQIQQDFVEQATKPNQTVVELSDIERQDALQFLKSPNLIQRILDDFDACGLVGEESNKLVCYLAAVSRLLDDPLAVLIQSGSAAGKTSLMDATLAFVPDEHQVRYSAMTGQSLYYMGGTSLAHRILAVAEEEGVSQASYALKLLQSDGRLTIATAGRNNSTGRQETETYEVEGPVMMFLTTTNEKPDPELQNRCMTIHVNETPEQTAAIHERQRAAYTLNGHLSSRSSIRTRHQNVQRLLERLPVVIPWASQLGFRSDQTRMRRDHQKYLSLIASITLLHQHQRPRRHRELEGEPIEYLEATIEDVELANRLASDVMGQSLDSLLPQTRQLLVLIDNHVSRRSKDEQTPRKMIRFTQRELRESLGWGDFQLRRHLSRLVELEYVLARRAGQGNQREYQLLYDGEGRNGERFVLGLVDPARLACTT